MIDSAAQIIKKYDQKLYLRRLRPFSAICSEASIRQPFIKYTSWTPDLRVTNAFGDCVDIIMTKLTQFNSAHVSEKELKPRDA